MKTVYFLTVLLRGVVSLSLPQTFDDLETGLSPRDTEAAESCQNSATSRSCWGNYSIDTNYYVRPPPLY